MSDHNVFLALTELRDAGAAAARATAELAAALRELSAAVEGSR